MIKFDVEGRAKVPGGRVWYGVCGDLSTGATPLLAVHGGPGMSHDYLAPLADLAPERPVIFYDQLDAGRSDRPNDPANWALPRFVAEVDALRDALGLTRLHLFGNSWGGTIAAAYASARPEGLQSLILSSPLIHTDTWLADNGAYRAALPAETLATMDRLEAEERTDAPDYLTAVDVFYARHLCRAQPWPEEVLRTFEVMNPDCYAAMWGPNEFTCSGVLRGYDGRAGLARIAATTLVTCGEYDEATPASTARFAAMIPSAEFEMFPNASHMAFIETRAAYIARLSTFLNARQA
ncbi:proline iminopeptidase-family hydrolase [Roseovarius sp. LXJ103]|uniref:proline iminopeptidase-family hydrolase n=1 Tax=Roseovarius carneus TaxID=2853164 RepID=UPI000D60C349|nr:proline iminopeptidase-family hydrolase [Roseovarius carneus]MBZ8118933.1 proline iminopeptidase-family hydrolase [Roseovarius carneus]PWE35412.1 proline iminopeptidase [Pelagicola sp. LXJ1103]